MRKTRRRSGKTRSRWGPQSLVHGLLRGSSSWRVAWRHGLRGSASRRRSISHSPGRRSFLLRIPPLSSLHSPLFPEVSLLPCPSSDSYATLILFSFPFRLFHYFPLNSFFLFVFFTPLLFLFFFSIRFLVCNFQSYRLVIISELLVSKFFRTNSCSFHVQRYTKYSKYGVLCNCY